MEHQSYYRNLEIPHSDQSIFTEPLIVNCAGQCYMKTPINNRNRRHDYYLKFITKGVLYFRLTDLSICLQPGDFLIIPPDTLYEYHSQSDSVTSYYWCHFTGNIADALLHSISMETLKIYQAPDCLHEMRTKFQNMFDEFTNRQAGFDASCAAKLVDILVTLLRRTTYTDHQTATKLMTVAWLHRHFTEDISVKELAEIEHMSESWYRKIFRHQMGMSPNEYRINLRMQYACDLLTATDNSISAIAQVCGYDDVLYFIRLFKQRIGLPPGEYRRKNRINSNASLV